jgi:hypothetical protein
LSGDGPLANETGNSMALEEVYGPHADHGLRLAGRKVAAHRVS